DCHEQSECRFDQCFGNSASNRRDSGSFSRLHTLERSNDPDDRSEQAHERGSRADGRKTRKAALELGCLEGSCALKGSARCVHRGPGYIRAGLMGLELLKTRVDDHREVRFLVTVGNGYCLVDAIVAQSGGNFWCKLTRLIPCRIECQPALDHYSDRVHAHDCE